MLEKKRIRGLEIFGHPAFRRTIPSSQIRTQALAELKRELKIGLFNSLPMVSGYPGESERVRLFEFSGHRFVIKDTRGNIMHGHSGKDGYSKENDPLRQFMLSHHRLARKNKPTRYILRTPMVFDQLDNYIVMEYIQHWSPASQEERTAIDLAHTEIFHDFDKVPQRGNWPKRFPQVVDFIPTGIYKGKIVFYAVKDYI